MQRKINYFLTFSLFLLKAAQVPKQLALPPLVAASASSAKTSKLLHTITTTTHTDCALNEYLTGHKPAVAAAELIE